MKIQKFSRAARAEMLAQRVTEDTLNAIQVAGAGDSSCRRVWPVWVTSLRRFCMQIPSFENPFGVASNVEIN